MNHPGTLFRHRGFTLLELLLALAITAIVGAAITSMLGAVSTGVITRRDSRSAMLVANAAQARLSAYMTPSRCVLDLDGDLLVVWLKDSRESDTVHATEVRWIEYDPEDGAIDVYWVEFPDSFRQTKKDLNDLEYPAASNWRLNRSYYENLGWISSVRLVDSLRGLTIQADQDPLLARHVLFSLTLDIDNTTEEVLITTTIRDHQPPSH